MTDLFDFIRYPGVANVAAAIAAYALLSLAMLPVWPITIVIGSIYGIWHGLLVAMPASVGGATAAFVLGRSVLRDWARRRMARWQRLEAISRAVADQGGWIVFLLRLSPIVPFNFLNYALSVTDLRLSVYIMSTVLGILPATIVYLYLGSVTAAVARGTTYNAWEMTLYVGGFVVTALAIWLVGRAVRRRVETELLSR